MGIKGLTQLLKQKSPECMDHVGLYTFKDKTVAIDTSIFLYKSLMNVRSKGDYLRNAKGEPVSHIIGLYHKTIQFLSLGITPIYVFDGRPPVEKSECISKRNAKAQACKDKMEGASDVDKLELEKGSIRIKKHHIDDLKRLFDLMGVSYIQSDGEAESYAGELCRMGYVDAVVTEDMDTLVYGPTLVLRNCIDRSIKRSDVVTSFSYETILKTLDMTAEQFTDMCILCGCDYCPTIPKIGSVRAYQHIKHFGTIEKLIESERFDVSEEFRERYPKARKLFAMYRDTLDPETIPIHKSTYQSDNLYNYLVSECNMSETKVQNSLKKIHR